ncbi:MAG: cupin-like domain-containing protein [Microcoleaceae cyanobacterium]
MSESKPLKITLPPLQITLQDEQQVSLQWLPQNPVSQPPELPASLSDSWKTWIAINQLLKQPDNSILQRMVDQGIDVKLALEEISQSSNHPYVKAGEQFLQQLQKLESILKIQNQLAALSSQANTIPRIPSLSRQEFLEYYYVKNTPVILTGMMQRWAALHLWDLDYLQQYYGDAEVEVQAERQSDPEYELNIEKHRKTILFKEYIDWVKKADSSNDYYMVANNNNLDREEMQGLLNDIEIFPDYLNPDERTGRIFFWFGPTGTVTPLHHDPVNLILAQVMGRKRIKLFPPQQTPFLYNQVGVFSKVDPENPNLEKYPLFKQAKPIEVILEPGEAIFIPVGWWHHVRSLDLSISVSFTNFVFPNHYQWRNPTFGRSD